MKTGFASYFASLLAKAPVSDVARQLSTRFKVVAEPADTGDYLKKCFNPAVEPFEKDRGPYVQLFQPAHMESYRENASTFRSRLVTKCPVIHKTLHSKREELHDWKMRLGKQSLRNSPTFSQILWTLKARMPIQWTDARLPSSTRSTTSNLVRSRTKSTRSRASSAWKSNPPCYITWNLGCTLAAVASICMHCTF